MAEESGVDGLCAARCKARQTNCNSKLNVKPNLVCTKNSGAVDMAKRYLASICGFANLTLLVVGWRTSQ